MWSDLLRAQVKARGLGPVARELNYSKTTLSLACNGKYLRDTQRLEAAVLRAYGTVSCPFEDREIEITTCRLWRERDANASSTWELRHWSACQRCTHNPQAKDAL